jgi:hypothetical protein
MRFHFQNKMKKDITQIIWFTRYRTGIYMTQSQEMVAINKYIKILICVSKMSIVFIIMSYFYFRYKLNNYYTGAGFINP